MSLACSTLSYSFRTPERTRSGSLSSGGPHPPPPPLRRLTFSPRTRLSPPTFRSTLASLPRLDDGGGAEGQVVRDRPDGGGGGEDGARGQPVGHVRGQGRRDQVDGLRHRPPVRGRRRGTDREEDAAFRPDEVEGSEEAG